MKVPITHLSLVIFLFFSNKLLWGKKWLAQELRYLVDYPHLISEGACFKLQTAVSSHPAELERWTKQLGYYFPLGRAGLVWAPCLTRHLFLPPSLFLQVRFKRKILFCEKFRFIKRYKESTKFLEYLWSNLWVFPDAIIIHQHGIFANIENQCVQYCIQD